MKFEFTPVRRREAGIIAGIAALYLLIWILLPKPSFWGLDSGIKFQGMQSFAEHGTIELPDRGIEYNFPPEYRSLPNPFSLKRDNTQTPVFSTVFMVLGGIFQRLFGGWGPFLLPLFGGWFALYAAWLLWIKQRGMHDGNAYLILVGLGTPLMFYSLELWEHTIATALITLAFVYLPTRSGEGSHRDHHHGVLLSGILIALAALFRTEAGAIFAIALIFWRLTNRSNNSALRFVFGGLIVAVPGMIINYWLTGEPYPLQLLSNILYRPLNNIFDLAITRAQNLYVLTLQGFDENLFSVFGIIPLLSLPFWRSWRNERGWWPYVFAALLGVGVFYFWKSISAPNRIGYTVVSGGLFWVTPFVALALTPLKGERRKFWQFSWAIWALFVLVVASFFPSVIGVHWGPRMVLVVLPLALLIAVTRAQRWWEHYEAARPIIGLLFVGSIVAQLYSVTILSSQRIENAALNKWAAAANPNPVITNLWWMPGDCSIASYKQPWFINKYAEDIIFSINSFRKAGVERFSFIETPPYVSDGAWIRFGAQRVGDDKFSRGKHGYRRTILEITANEADSTAIEPQDRTRVRR